MSTPDIAPIPATGFDIETGTLIIGAGACGLVAALAATETGQDVLVIEADAVPAGSTALSAGLIPAAGTAIQQAAGIDDSAELFVNDIQRKADAQNDAELVTTLAVESATVINWLAHDHQLALTLVDDFDYPGHSRRRMHGLPRRAGSELIDTLRHRCEQAGVDIIFKRRARTLHYDRQTVYGVTVETAEPTQLPDKKHDALNESIGCRKLILACNGFGGNRTMVANHMPDIKDALWFGHSGNQGEAVIWGQQIGARIQHLGAYQGHGNVAHPHGILISWAVIMEGGVQVNRSGRRFWNESTGYSEAARAVLSQPESCAVTIFDQRIATIARQFQDFRQAEASGAVQSFQTLDALAKHFQLPAHALHQTLQAIPANATDEFGRYFDQPPLQPPYYAVRVTGALFHTQGGLMVDANARVLHQSGHPFNNLYAGGGAACGVSGCSDYGYLSGNGLLSAVVLGYLAGRH